MLPTCARETFKDQGGKDFGKLTVDRNEPIAAGHVKIS
jgi:hypothetical protein